MRRRLLLGGLIAAVALAILLPPALDALDRRYPPDLSKLERLSVEVLDREGRPLRRYLSADGALRLPAATAAVDPRYRAMLIAYEDKRFYSHPGVDPLAVARAAWQALRYGRIVSGASTLTMQAARLLEPRPRTLRSKLVEMARALQLERRFTKDEILSIYLSLAPFGGTVEGVEAASRVFFGKTAESLSLAEAALLVALPQAPTRLRPDRRPDAARQARVKVLTRVAERLGLEPADVTGIAAEPLRLAEVARPFAAPHLADRLSADAPPGASIGTSLDGALQRRLEALARRKARALGPDTSLAVLAVENSGRRVVAYVGSADFRDPRRLGQVDLVRAVRSPGSTLKPAIYALALERGLIHPATLIKDVPRRFGDYAPNNFRGEHYGEVTVSEALRLSLNVPAVAVLERLGPVAFAERLRRAGIDLRLSGPDARPGLALALGGVGMTLEDLVRLYAALADDGRVLPLGYGSDPPPANPVEPLFGPAARWYLAEILRGLPAPEGGLSETGRRGLRGLAYKTGTSYGFRDAWAIGSSATHTIGIWVGRPDGTPSPGRYGANTAAPLLFEIFDYLGVPPVAAEAPPAEALVADTAALPPPLRRFDPRDIVRRDGTAPRILFPPDRSRLVLPGQARALVLEAEGGRRPYSWMVNGRPLEGRAHSRRIHWQPDGPGFAQVVLVDGAGRRSEAWIDLVAAPD